MSRYLHFLNRCVFAALAFSSSIIYCKGESSEINPDRAQDLIIFLSSPRSGSELVSCSLNIATRKLIGMFPSGRIHRLAMSHLRLPPAASIPLFYRTHKADLVRKVPSDSNKLIFLTRNPKELFFRRQRSISSVEEFRKKYTQEIMADYFERFKVYDSWNPNNRYLLFYEDFINQEEEEILLELLDFMGEEPTFFYDYVENKERYLDTVLSGYKRQHRKGGSGASSKDGPKSIYYTKDKDPRLLKCLDQIFREQEPVIWEKYLKRFETL